MAKLRGTLQGRRGEASRLGDTRIHASVNSWEREVSVMMDDESECTVRVGTYGYGTRERAGANVSLYMHTMSNHARWRREVYGAGNPRRQAAIRRENIERKWSGDYGLWGGEEWGANFTVNGEILHIRVNPETGAYTVEQRPASGSTAVVPVANGVLGGYLRTREAPPLAAPTTPIPGATVAS